MTRSLPAWVREVVERLAPERVYRNGLWANPPGALIDRLYAEARRAMRAHRAHVCAGDPVLAMQPYWRKVHDEFHRRLKAAGIYVEGGL
jgi:hypothetical protein